MAADGPLYDLALRAAGPLLRAGAPLSPKLRRGLDGRRAALGALARWAAAAREPARPLFWLHAPSVGEALMAQAIITELRRARTDAQVAFTFFSPSAERMAPRVGADFAGYLPWDTRANGRAALAALRPAAIGFVRTEIWPGIVGAANAADVPAALLNAVLGPRSSRLRWPARRLLAAAYARLAAVGAVSEADATRFAELGVPSPHVRVTGDARFDQVLARLAATATSTPLLARLADGVPTVVAGSTWPADERRLVPALAEVRERRSLRLIIAPHEPNPDHLAGVERTLRAHGFAAARLAAVEAGGGPGPDAIIVDRVGVLADLYRVATAAYVGGGFSRAGLHSVVEPAALGVPVAYGPAFGNAQEAAALAAAGGGVVAHDAAALVRAFANWLGEPAQHAVAASAARRFVEERRGGAARNAELLLAVTR